MKKYNTITLEVENCIATIYFNRPEQYNAISEEMIDEINDAITVISNDPQIKAAIFTGNGKAFCAGLDIKEAAGVEKPLANYNFLAKRQSVVNKIANLEIPTIGAINGVALGGGFEIALTFDFLIAADKASFGVPEINIGVLPGLGGMSRLPHRVGLPLAKKLVLLGERLSAEEAYSIGIVYKVVPLEQLLDEAKKLADSLAQKPPIGIKFGKKVLERALRMEIEDAMDYEARVAALLYDTEDRKEGMAAFNEKRKPNFKGK